MEAMLHSFRVFGSGHGYHLGGRGLHGTLVHRARDRCSR